MTPQQKINVEQLKKMQHRTVARSAILGFVLGAIYVWALEGGYVVQNHTEFWFVLGFHIVISLALTAILLPIVFPFVLQKTDSDPQIAHSRIFRTLLHLPLGGFTLLAFAALLSPGTVGPLCPPYPPVSATPYLTPEIMVNAITITALTVLGATLLGFIIASIKTRSGVAIFATEVFLLSLIIAGFLFVVFSAGTHRGKSYDGRRLADIKVVQLTLEMYRDHNLGAYPIINTSNTTTDWQKLRDMLVPTYSKFIPNDLCANEFPERQYVYRSSPDGNTYVLRAILSKPITFDDEDGFIFEVWCGGTKNDLEFCVTPE